MAQQGITVSFDHGDGKTITIETGKLATQAHGSVMVRQGDCMILATVVSNKEIKEDQSFFPLSVDYVEKFAAAGRIPGSFHRREGRLNDYEILVSRLTDRVLRPMFNEDYLAETQVNIWMVSSDKDILPDAMAALAASSALAVSDIPFNGPISEVRVSKIDGKFVINPTKTENERAELDILVGASEKNIVMVEGEAKEVSEADLVEAIRVGHEAVKKAVAAQNHLKSLVNKPIRDYEKPATNPELQALINATLRGLVMDICKSGKSKTERHDALADLLESFTERYLVEHPDAEETTLKLIKKYYQDLEYYTMRDMILDDHQRLDGRSMDQVRPIWMEVDYLPGTHGSAVFTRGETQALTSVTLGTKLDEQMEDKAMELVYKDFLLHYNFPGFSTGEVRPNRGPGRREVGHGNLALRSLKNMLPTGEANPYTIRIVSDILESNGSSSMATVCAGSLALHDAGVQMPSHVSGIAMGLITRADGKTAILTDILGDEDHLGDMDFKVTGTRKGICGCQMDIKIDGLSFELLSKALDQAKVARLKILDLMYEAMPAPRPDYKPHAPRIEKIFIAQDMIGAVIGPGGKVIQDIQKTTGTVIVLEEIDNRGEISISASNKEAIEAAKARIKAIVYEPEVGDIFDATVKSIKDFGAFVEILPGKEGLLHISEISNKRVDKMDGIFKVGDKVKVKLIGYEKTGKMRLSAKALLPKE